MCFNHPWRPAYAQCSYCKRYFCYADLIEYGKQEYCLEDLSRAGQPSKITKFTPNRFTYIASALFIVNSFLIFYFIYPQVSLITTQINHLGLSGFLKQLTYGSEVILLNMAFVVMGFISSISVLSNSGKRFGVSVAVLFMMAVFFSYEYVSTTSTGAPDYFLYVTIILLVNMLVLVLSRLSYVGGASEERFTEQIEWPKVETF